MTWKKRIISIALCLCALLCAASVRADAAEHSHPICGASHKNIGNHTGTCSSQTWTAWDGTDMDTNADDIQLTAGHYYLSDNVTLDSTIEISGEVYLCLNGCTLSYSKYVSGDSNSVGGMVLLDNSAVLNVCDCKGDGNIVHDYNYDSNWRKSTVRVKRGSTLNLYGGSVIMERGKAVAAVDLDYDTGANFYMYGGKVENKSTHYDPYSTYAVHVYGNSSQDSGSNVKIYGGEIICKNGYGIRVFYEARPSILVAGGKIESGNKAIEVSYAALTLQGKPTISTTDQDYAAIGLSQSSPLIKVTSDFAPETPVSVGKTSLTTGTEFAEPAADNETLAAEARAFVSHEAGYFIENNANGRLQFTACAITGQPNEENGYTVTANGTPGYQWYTATKGEIPVTESNTTKHYSYLRYFDQTGEWFASSIPDANTGLFTIQMGEGDTLKLDFNYVSVEKVTLTDGTQRVIEGEQAGNNSYTITVGEAGEYTLKVDATANEYGESGEPSYLQFTATMTGYVAGQSMPGQTDRKLSTEGLGGNYLCKVTWESKTELTSLSVHVHDWQPATCTAPKTCSVCRTTEGTALGHAWQPATCTAPKTCSVCHTTEGTALAHAWQPATCTAPKTCSVCQATEGAAKGHSWVDATCTTPKTCSVCKTTEGTALGHAWDTEWSKDNDYHWHKCKNCDAITDLTAHVPGAAATETTPQLCTKCGYVIAPATHPVHTWVFVAETPATCNAAGEREHYKCTCGRTSFKNGDVYNINEDASVLTIEKNSANHTGAPDSKWHSDSANHWQEYTCCYARANEAAHSGGAATCTAQAVCQVCGKAYGPLAAHDWGAWEVTTPATKDAPGVETRTCTHNSAHTETRSIPKLSTAVYTVSEDTKIAQIEAKVDGLDKILESNENKALVNDGKSVGVSLTVKNTASSGVSEKIKEKLAGSNLVGLRLELTVEKTVTENGAVVERENIPDTGVLLRTTITLPAELQGKSGYVVYRLHGDAVHVLTETPNENGEFISVSADKTQITICARLYSEYVIAYQTGGSSGGGYHPVNPTPVKATSANTGDAGVLLYGVTAALSLTGTAWLGAKSRKH